MPTEVERTLIIVKPDGVQRALTGEILGRFEKRGLKLVGLKMIHIDRPLAERHYAVHREKPFFGELISYITLSPVVVAVLEGPRAIEIVRAMIGKTRPHEAASGTIRGDFAVEGLRNLVHASDAPDTAKNEIDLYFKGGEVLDYQRELDRWIRD
ncbi:MAG TPA: nucleoside-diphosphate kinase [Chloroflexota bacterium]|nr:nucleoside-diphosphate kinase [Chloroflexota bacterium]